MGKYFEVFFVCPHCGAPIVRKDALSEHIKKGAKYCGNCGEYIASICEEILAEENEAQN